MIPGKLICLPFNLRKRTLLFWSFLCALPTQKSLLARNFIIVHYFFAFLESFNTHVCIPKQTHSWASCKWSNRPCISLYLCLLNLMLPSSRQKCIPVVYPFHYCTFHCVGGGYHNWLICSTTDGHSGCFQFWVIATGLLLRLLVHVSKNFFQE